MTSAANSHFHMHFRNNAAWVENVDKAGQIPRASVFFENEQRRLPPGPASMINSSPLEYAFIRVCIVFLQAITPVSVAYTLYEVFRLFAHAPWHLPTAPLVLRIWFGVETAFYVCVLLPLLHHIQHDAVHPPLLPAEKRRELFERIVGDISPVECERHLRWWFRGAPLSDIGRDGVADWLAWAFFEGRIDGDGHRTTAELDEYTDRFEGLLGKSFPPGYGIAKPIRLTLDPILLSHRSLLWYWMVGFVDFLTYMHLSWIGLQHHRLPLKHFFALFPFRPIALTATEVSPVPHLSYWYREHTSKTRLPIVFIHGIGIGLYPYAHFLSELNTFVKDGDRNEAEDGQVGILALEIMPVAFRITHSALSKQAMCDEINSILQHHGWDKFVLTSHSYGTVVATHMLHDSVLQPKIASLLLIDPVCFLLHQPDVAYNFTDRNPTHANEWQLWYFASKDPGVAHTLGRRFFWSENVLWLEDLQQLMQRRNVRVTVSLAGRDLIVDTETVGRYLAGEKLGKDGRWSEEWKGREWKGEGLELIWNDDTDHAQVFDKEHKRRRLVKAVRTYCEISD